MLRVDKEVGHLKGMFTAPASLLVAGAVLLPPDMSEAFKDALLLVLLQQYSMHLLVACTTAVMKPFDISV